MSYMIKMDCRKCLNNHNVDIYWLKDGIICAIPSLFFKNKKEVIHG